MKANIVNVLVAVFVSALTAYGLWNIENELKGYIAVGTFVFMASTLVPMIGGSYEYTRNAVNLRVVCAIFFVFGVGTNLFFSLVGMSAVSYIITISLLFLIYVFIGNAIYNAKQ